LLLGTEEMNEKGYALVLRLLPGQYCEDLISKYDNPDLYRKTVTKERHSFGLGEYKYFKFGLDSHPIFECDITSHRNY
jgi:uncharacterized protein